MGPTASGKTSLAIDVAKELNGEVISVDSALIFEDMDIGTAKPTKLEMDGIRHHLIDIVSPENSYSVAEFLGDVEVCIDAVIKRGKQPILAGGTMMYFNALINGLNTLPPSNPQVRLQLQTQIEQKGLLYLHQNLAELDPKSAEKIHPNDPQRIIRALEVYKSTGKSLSAWQAETKNKLAYNFIQFSIMPSERAELHKNIEIRFDQMLANGFIDEVESLLRKYTLHEDLPALRCVGYRQVWQYLQGQLDQHEMRERGVIATRQLAKRQVTWLRGWPNLMSLTSNTCSNVSTVVKKVSATE